MDLLEQELSVDPVHEDNEWWFWDETWSYRHGPFSTEAAARKALDLYAEALDGEVGTTVSLPAYDVIIRLVEIEGEVCFEARVKELPDLVEYADSADDAYALVVDAIETTARALAAKGGTMPPPFNMLEGDKE